MGVKTLDSFKSFHIGTKESVWSWEISIPFEVSRNQAVLRKQSALCRFEL